MPEPIVPTDAQERRFTAVTEGPFAPYVLDDVTGKMAPFTAAAVALVSADMLEVGESEIDSLGWLDGAVTR
jgi:hypothetical protein